MATIHAVITAPSMSACIASMEHPDPNMRRVPDFAAIEAAIKAAERLVETLGPDTVVPGSHGRTARGLLIEVQDVAAAAEPYRPKARRA
jgi:hypothetical protein